MNKNIKNGALLALAASAGITGCSRYEEGPVSLRSPMSRLEGDWELKNSENEEVDNFLDNGGQVILEFDKDGDVTYKLRGEYTYSYYSYWYGYTTLTYDINENFDGDWEFENKKKEIEIHLDGAEKVEFDILRLSKTEMILEDEDGYEWEFEKE